MAEPARYRVLVDYEVNDPHPLRLERGEAVRRGQQDAGRPGGVWVDAGHQAGWIPESCLTQEDDSATRVQRPFDGGDLSARRGEFLEALEEASGWVYARKESGETGWFPLFNLKPVPRT